MANKLPIDPLWTPQPQALKPRDLRRIQRHALPAFTRAAPYPLDRYAEEQHQRRVLFWQNVVFFCEAFVIVLCLIAAATRAG